MVTSEAALLVIDVQDSFKARGGLWARRSNPAFESNVSRLIEAFRAHARAVVFVLHSDADPEFSPDGEHYRLQDFLQAREDEAVLHKTTRSVFASTDLLQRLRDLGARRLVISGIQTEQCCETTTRDAADLGFEVEFVTEATLTFPIPHWNGGPELSAEEVTRRTEYALAGRFACIRTVEQVVASLEPLPA